MDDYEKRCLQGEFARKVHENTLQIDLDKKSVKGYCRAKDLKEQFKRLEEITRRKV